MVPPWTPAPPAGEVAPAGPNAPAAPPVPQPNSEPTSNTNQTADPSVPSAPVEPRVRVPAPLAPAARFSGARRALGDYARSGDSSELRRSLGHYVRTGYGGSGTSTRRFEGTARTAGALGGALANVSAGQPAAPGSSLDPALLSGRTATEVMDAVVEAVRPVDGTQDAEAERAAIRDSLSDLLTRFPEADLLNLDSDQRAFAIERFTAIDVFRRFELDVGKTIVEKAPSATAALARLKEARDYIKESVGAAFRKLRNEGRTVASGRISEIVRDALKETFEVFEGYAE